MTDLEALMEYIRQPGTDYAYMITGPWGSGKSYFWNHVVVPAIKMDAAWNDENRPIPVYVSLYSIRNLDEIQRAILLQTHPKLAKTGKVASVVGRGLLEFFNLGGLADDTDVEKWLESLTKRSNLVICFDDLERAPRAASRVLGHINQYVEHLGMKVVILCHEDEIMRRKSDKEYRRTKEKVVRITRRFTGDTNKALDQIIGEFAGRKDYHAYLTVHRQEIKTLFEYSGLPNLRILKYGLNVLETAFNAYRELAKDDADRLAQLPATLLPVTFEFQRGDLKDEEVVEILTDGNRVFYATMFADEKSKKTTISQFVTKYKVGSFIKHSLTSPAFANLIISGHLNKADLKAELVARSNKKSETQAAAIAFMEDWYILPDDNFGKTAQLTAECLRKGEISEWEYLIRLMRAIGDCDQYGLLPVPIDKYREAFTEGLKVLKGQGRFVRLDEWKAQHIGDFGNNSHELATWARQQLLAVNGELTAAEQKEEIAKAFKKLHAEPDDFVTMMTKSRGHGFGDEPIAPLIKAEDFVSEVAKASAHARHQLCFALRERYSTNGNVRALITDIHWLTEVRKRLQTAVASTTTKAPSTYWLTRLVEEVDEALEVLRSVKASSKV